MRVQQTRAHLRSGIRAFQASPLRRCPSIFCTSVARDAASISARPTREVRRIEVNPLRLLDGSVNGARTDLDAAAQQGGHLLQESVAALDRKRPGGGEDGS
jgi:hypothetical protein